MGSVDDDFGMYGGDMYFYVRVIIFSEFVGEKFVEFSEENFVCYKLYECDYKYKVVREVYFEVRVCV